MLGSKVGFFGDGGSNGAISGSNKSKMAAAAILEKFQMAISPQPVVRSTPCWVPEHVSGAWAADLPLTAQAYFCDTRSPLRSRSSSASAHPIFRPLRSSHML